MVSIVVSDSPCGLQPFWLRTASLFYRSFHVLAALVIAFSLTSLAWAESEQACEPEMARLTSIQGEVEIRPGEAEPWRDAGLGDVLCLGSTVRVGGFSRAALAFADDSTLRLDQDTTLVIREREEERRTWLEMLSGAIHFFSHRPRALGVETPFVNAAAEGTEFLIRVNQAEAHILMFEGVVLAQNQAGELRLGPDDAALIRAGEKPVPEIVARPRDAVAWAVHYPPVLSDLADGGEPGAYPVHLQVAIKRTRENNYPSALRTLDLVPQDERDAPHETLRAGILLNVGRVAEAEAAIERALALEPDEPDAGDVYAQRSILHVVRNDRAQASRDADRAVQLSPDSSAALIAQSYARQANFDLEGARESLRAAVDKNPNDALAHARLAEIELSFGDIDRANEAADRAVRLAPDLARTQTVQGFARLAEIDTSAAREAFANAIALYSADPLPHLGQGLAKIR
ncbi:MAG: FecR domain-containing protein, partial [Alphaproteobacteria bacterium]|nr:FecR domain-containing protein [Alphaproteobacteria bacterium]